MVRPTLNVSKLTLDLSSCRVKLPASCFDPDTPSPPKNPKPSPRPSQPRGFDIGDYFGDGDGGDRKPPWPRDQIVFSPPLQLKEQLETGLIFGTAGPQAKESLMWGPKQSPTGEQPREMLGLLLGMDPPSPQPRTP